MQTVNSEDVKNIYFNEFGIGFSKNDALLVLRKNGKPEIVLNASHVTVKSLAKALNLAISEFEKETHHTILTFEEAELETAREE
jgi:hypothetical protein